MGVEGASFEIGQCALPADIDDNLVQRLPTTSRYL